MIDFMGKELSVGDTVIMIAPGYRSLVKGTITKFTPQKVRVEYFNSWNYSTPYKCEIIQESNQLVKVNI